MSPSESVQDTQRHQNLSTEIYSPGMESVRGERLQGKTASSSSSSSNNSDRKHCNELERAGVFSGVLKGKKGESVFWEADKLLLNRLAK